MSRRQWFAVHGWIGLTAGLMLFVICWSGTVAVFSGEIDWLLNPALRSASAPVEPAWEAIRQAAARAVPDGTVIQVARPTHAGSAAEAIVLRPGDRMWRVYADPATGAVLGDTSYFNVQRFFRSFHMNLFYLSADFDLGYWGFRLVEAFSFVLLASMAASLVFYRRWWRRWLKLEASKGRRILWSDLHKLSGLWSLWFIPLIGITGIWYLVEEFVPGSPEPPAPPEPTAHPGPSALPVDALVARARQAMPGFEVTRVSLEDPELVAVYGFDGAVLVRDRASMVWLDARDGAVVGVQPTAGLTALQRWIHTADPLHFGNFGGFWSKAVWFVFGLLLSGLSLTGAYLQVQRQRCRHSGERFRGPVLVAYVLTVAILLVAAVGGWYEIRSYGLPQGGVARFPPVPWGVSVFIGAWVISTAGALTIWMWKLR